MSSLRLNNIAILSIEHTLTCVTDFTDIINYFANKKARMIAL